MDLGFAVRSLWWRQGRLADRGAAESVRLPMIACEWALKSLRAC